MDLKAMFPATTLPPENGGKDLGKRSPRNCLLPAIHSHVEGLDIAGKSLYCDKTGGDFFDFLYNSDHRQRGFRVLVGDAVDHGARSADLMSSARSFLRRRSSGKGDLARIVTDVNRRFVRDVEESGEFVTLYYMSIDTSQRRITWVRAGHDPAILYDPMSDKFETLYGSGIAMGVDAGWQYCQNEKKGFGKGQIIVIGTDGIWEAHNAEGTMFGKDSLCSLIRQNADLKAGEIVDSVFHELLNFKNGTQPEDDITLVVIKIEE
jgi:sigma-B regulation protein RsbU (phosphoserine phosphatase)